MNIRILIVEDDIHIGEMAKKFLKKSGYSVDVCTNGDAALELFYNNRYELLILDIMLPGTSGHELLKEFRKISQAPVLMMTALSDEENQIQAFNNQTDDYVTKPFLMSVLVKRVDALLRRSGVLKKEINAGALTLFPETLTAECVGQTVQLSPKEFDILMLLALNKGKIVPRETLLTKIWGYDFGGNEGIIHASIKKLRDKLPGSLIKTVKGVGYCLEERQNEE